MSRPSNRYPRGDDPDRNVKRRREEAKEESRAGGSEHHAVEIPLAIKKMITSKRRRKISESVVNSGFVYTPDLKEPDRRIKFCGLLDILKRVCYPDHDYEEAKKLDKKAKRKKTGLKNPWQGRKRGDLAHKQVRAIVNAGEDSLQAMFGNERSTNALNFLDSLSAKRLVRVEAEFVDFYSSISLASSIDLLCARDGKLVLIEMKNGFDNTFDQSNGPLTNPPSLRSYSNSPRHQSYLQLLFYRKMIEDHYPDVKIGKCYVAQVKYKCTEYHQLPKDFVLASEELVDCVAAARLSQLSDKR